MNDGREWVPSGCVSPACVCPQCMHVPDVSPVYLQHVQGLSVFILFVCLFMPPTYPAEDLRALNKVTQNSRKAYKLEVGET